MVRMSKGLVAGLHHRCVAARNRVLASPGFRRFAARCWLTRPVALVRGGRVVNLVGCLVYSQTLAACLETRLLELLAEETLASTAITARIGLSHEATLRLLRAGAAIGLVERVGDRWTLGSDGAALRGNGGIAEMVAHHRLLYADLADPVALLRGERAGTLAGYWDYDKASDSDAAAAAPYSRLMAASQPLVAAQILDSYRFARHRRLLDVGGGEGRFLESVGARVAGLELALFDLPAVGARAQTRLDSAGLGDRVTIHSGSFLVDPLPRGHDLITLVRVLHDHDDAPALALLRAVHAALPPGGRLLIAEPMAGTPGAEPAGDAYFGLYLLAMGSGRPRTPREIGAMLAAAGFRTSRLVATALPLTCRVMIACR
jgi:demethylspheroidene O-methyltransferase